MASGQYKLTSNHRCVESGLCPYSALLKEEKRRGRRSEKLIITPYERETVLERERQSVRKGAIGRWKQDRDRERDGDRDGIGDRDREGVKIYRK